MTQRSPFRYFKTSPEVIRLAVMLYVRFPLSLRNVEDLLHERGIEVSALVLLADLPPAKRLLGDRGYDAVWLRDELKARGLRICIPARRGRRRPASHNRKLYRKRCRIENAFARLKDWRAIAMRDTRCGDLFLSATAHAATVIFWLR